MSKSVLSIILTIAVLFSSIVCFTASATSQKKPVRMRGDVDCDGSVSVADARLVLRGAINVDENFICDEFSDYDSDDRVTVSDARLILRAAIGISPVLVPEKYIGTAEDPIRFDSTYHYDAERAGQYYSANTFLHFSNLEAVESEIGFNGKVVYFDENGDRQEIYVDDVIHPVETKQYCKDCGQEISSYYCENKHECSEKNWLLYKGKHYPGCFCEYCGWATVFSSYICNRAVCDTICDMCGKTIVAETCHHCSNAHL